MFGLEHLPPAWHGAKWAPAGGLRFQGKFHSHPQSRVTAEERAALLLQWTEREIAIADCQKSFLGVDSFDVQTFAAFQTYTAQPEQSAATDNVQDDVEMSTPASVSRQCSVRSLSSLVEEEEANALISRVIDNTTMVTPSASEVGDTGQSASHTGLNPQSSDSEDSDVVMECVPPSPSHCAPEVGDTVIVDRCDNTATAHSKTKYADSNC